MHFKRLIFLILILTFSYGTLTYSDDYEEKTINLNEYEFRIDTTNLYALDSDNESYRDALNSEQQMLYDYILNSLVPENITYGAIGSTGNSNKVTIDFNYFNYFDTTPDLDNMFYVARAVINDNPQIYWLNPSTVAATRMSSGYCTITIKSICDTETAIAENNEIEAWRKNIAERASLFDTDIEKILFLNEEIAANTTYGLGENSAYAHTVTGVALNGQAVCEGYSKALQLILSDLNIKSIFMPGRTSATLTSDNHAWLAVNIDGSWYHCDLTWNDTDNSDVYKTQYIAFGEDSEGVADRHYYTNSLNINFSQTDYEINIPKDLNGDSRINFNDAILILKYSAGSYSFSDEQLKAADCNRDKTVNYQDAILVLKYASDN